MKIHGWKMKFPLPPSFIHHLVLYLINPSFCWAEISTTKQTTNFARPTLSLLAAITCSVRDSDSHPSWWLILGKETIVLIEGPREKMGILRKHGVETLAFYPTSKTNMSTYYPWKLMVQVGYQWNFPSLKALSLFTRRNLLSINFSVGVGV